MNNKSFGSIILAALGIAGVLFVLEIILCAFCFIGGWIAGWFAKLILGDLLCQGFALLGIAITPDKLPLLGGLLGWISAFFKVNIDSNKN